jgi:predicted phage baseplate assembly protein
MPLNVPQLDDRTFQQLVDEAKKRIPHYTKEWTDHNVSDPGVTLIELFAWMTETLLYRLNQVPDLHYVRLMEMLGIHLQAPVPASAPVTFWLSAPQSGPVVIPAGTEVASTQTETRRSIVFTTQDDLEIRPPDLQHVLSRVTRESGEKAYRTHNLRRLEAGFEGANVYSDVPQVDDALYFAFENDLSHHVLGLELDFDPAGGAGIDPSLPPYIWEASTGDDTRWQPCRAELDTTKGMNVGGRILLHLPQVGQLHINKHSGYWLRARIQAISARQAEDGMRPYRVSPRLRRVAAASWGGAVAATHAQTVRDEFLGRSDGTPGQRFRLQRRPVLPRQPGETLWLQVEGQEPQPWQEVSDFASSRARDRHFTLDSVDGELRLGPAVRQPDGTIKLYGAIPPRGANLVFRRYRVGGGQAGNVQEGVLNTLKTAIPYVARISNLEPATGGLDAETLEAAQARAPAVLRSRDRAVTAEDFEFLAREALPAAIGRVRCLQPRPAEAGRVAPGQLYLLVVPRIAQPVRFLAPEELALDEESIRVLTAYLDERRLLTTRLSVRTPEYRWVAVRVQLRAAAGADQNAVRAAVLSRLHRFLNPLAGGPDGRGWPFGRDLFLSDVYQSLQGLEDVQFVRGVELYAARAGGEPEGEPQESLEVVAHSVVASAQHEVVFV